MTVYENSHTNPYFNLAAEQYLMDGSRDEIFMLWRNEPAVIIGRNQNAYAEINAEFVAGSGIAVVRRLTGGGAVFHDLGNVNYTVIANTDKYAALDFARFTEPVIRALRALGVPAELSGRNDIVADGKKISGNAQCVRDGRIMHHGTLLYSADLSRLSGALRVDPEKIRSKGIKSVRSRVGNICDFLPDPKPDTVEFMEYLSGCFEGERRSFSESEERGIQRLADTVYSTWEHNYGSSGEFGIKKRRRFSFGSVEAELTAEHGVIADIRLRGDFFGSCDISELEALLCGARYEKAELRSLLAGASELVAHCISGATPEDIEGLFFAANESDSKNDC